MILISFASFSDSIVDFSWWGHLLLSDDTNMDKCIYWTFIGRSTLFGRVILWNHSRQSVCSFVTNFFQDWIIGFFLHFIWWWLTMISGDWQSEMKKWRPKFGLNGLKSGPRWDFFTLSLDHIFLEITYVASLQQFLTSSRDKVQEKNYRAQIWAKIGSGIRFFAIFLCLVH